MPPAVAPTSPQVPPHWRRLASQRYSWTSSMRVPKLPFGCTKATVVPRLPGRGAWSIGGGAGGDHRGEGRGAVVDAVADVVEALAALLDRLGDRGVGAGGRGELDVGVGDLDEGLLDAVAVDDLAVVHLGAERLLVVGDGRLQVADGDGDVVDLGEQAASSS